MILLIIFKKELYIYDSGLFRRKCESGIKENAKKNYRKMKKKKSQVIVRPIVSIAI